jgi:L-fuconate dehydratase
VLFNHIALDHEAIFLEHIPHLQDRFTEPVRIIGARYSTPQLPGTSCELK